MRSLVLITLLISSLISGCQARESGGTTNSPASSPQGTQGAESEGSLRSELYERARSRNGGKEPTKLELFNALVGKAQEHIDTPKTNRNPRTVARGARPEIIIRGSEISINGTRVSIGDPIASWRNTLTESPVCHENSVRTLCVWDQLGIQVTTQSIKNAAVLDFTVYQNIEPLAPWNPQLPDGSMMKAPPDYRPKQAFPGYLELDGYGIDAKTQFWEIRAKADPKRNLRCGSRDCSHPHGGFSDKANLYLRLNGATENSTLYEFTISANEDSPQPQQ